MARVIVVIPSCGVAGSFRFGRPSSARVSWPPRVSRMQGGPSTFASVAHGPRACGPWHPPGVVVRVGCSSDDSVARGAWPVAALIFAFDGPRPMASSWILRDVWDALFISVAHGRQPVSHSPLVAPSCRVAFDFRFGCPRPFARAPLVVFSCGLGVQVDSVAHGSIVAPTSLSLEQNSTRLSTRLPAAHGHWTPRGSIVQGGARLTIRLPEAGGRVPLVAPSSSS